MTLRVEFDSWWAQALWPMIHVFLLGFPSERGLGVKVRHQRLEARLLLRAPFVLCHFLIELMKPKRKYPSTHFRPGVGENLKGVSKVYAKRVVSNWVAQCNREEMQNILVTVKLQCIHCDEKSGMRRPHWCAKSAKDARLQKKVKAAVAQ